MAFSIKNSEADSLVRELAGQTGESITETVVVSLRQRRERLASRGNLSLSDDLMEIGKRCASLPVLDERAADEILGYGDDGAP